MRRRFFLENGNWELAAIAVHNREPEKFETVESAKRFLLDNSKKHFASEPIATIHDIEPWFYGPICAMPSCMVQVTPEERFERLTVRFWESLKNEDRSDTEFPI